MRLKVSAPGSLMLMGEHAVLYGQYAVVAAIDKRITVYLQSREDDRINIQSVLGDYHAEIKNIPDNETFRFVIAVLKFYQKRFKKGCDIKIETDFSHTVGFSSSAAITISMLAAIVAWLNLQVSPFDLLRLGKQIIQQVQGAGSGADIAAAVYGGILGYRSQPLSIEVFNRTHPISVIYSGYKTATTKVIQLVKQKLLQRPLLYRQLLNCIGNCARESIKELRNGNWLGFGELMTVQQGLMVSLGVSNALLEEMLEGLRNQKEIKGAKISGSGLGDCIVGLGTITENISLPQCDTIEILSVAIASQGVKCEKE